MLVLEDLRFAYPEQVESYAFTMEARASEITAISGTSGSGKSTLLDLIGGFAVASDGSLSLDGEDLLPLPPEGRPLSLLLQSESLFEHLTVARNVALGLPNADRKAKQQIGEALEQVGLEGLEDRRAAALSGGQKQRVALARTLLRDKRLLLLDEPFSALDEETRAATRQLVRSLTRQQNWITILVSHNADDVRALADRHYVIRDKRLEQIPVEPIARSS
ncbi:hypothetical protein GCM10007989_25020 [Devosia pacifica]|uniref:ABC transporter domain-containing protein n=1 Tax=Devosia pacifica TaxID=1335967 RepID=A0A918VVY9_9HYPH|nr:ATP-binding cassette domain-containing protein [Devosia pacifica]GHA28046.1 hypothetical protein GCM10007989_25020 [Devosia pacifica]